MKIKHFINLHKATTLPVVLALMFIYDNFTIGPWVYLALHGTYGLLWLLKDRLYPDPKWEEEIAAPIGIASFFIISLYWVAPWLLISSGVQPPLPLIAAAITLNLIGTVLHYGSDAQKYYTLKYRRGLITEGFFALSRNPNYLGEICIYLSFALLAMHWQPYLILAGFIFGIFLPNMRAKDQSLARYPEFAAYQASTGFLFPKLFGRSTPEEVSQS